MNRFPELHDQIRAIARPVPLPSLPWVELTLFGILALMLALS